MTSHTDKKEKERLAKEKTKSRTKHEYENLKQKGEKGNFEDLIPPLDYLILERLPEEGKVAFGLYPEGESSANLAKTHFKPLDAGQIASRLKIMFQLGLVTKVRLLNNSREGYQRTARGKKVFLEWKEKNQ